MTARRLPDVLTVTLLADGRPLSGGWVDVHLGTTKKNSHGLLAGPTDGGGRVVVRRSAIEEAVREDLETSPMDYGGLDAWDGLINVEPIGRDRVRGVLDAIGLWGSLGSLRTDENLERFKAFGRSLENLAGAELTAIVSADPPDAATLTASVRRA